MKACLWLIALSSLALADSPAAGLDRATIEKAIAAVKPEATACGTKFSAKGHVKIHVVVAPSGALDSVTVALTPDRDLGDCVLAAMKKLTFPATQQGGSSSYPFVF